MKNLNFVGKKHTAFRFKWQILNNIHKTSVQFYNVDRTLFKHFKFSYLENLNYYIFRICTFK